MGARVMVTRPEPDAARTARKLTEMGFSPVVLPLTEIRSLPIDWVGMKVDAVAVTSPNALRHAPPTLLRQLTEKPLFVVGGKSAATARRAGFNHIVKGPGDARGLAAQIAARQEGGVVLYLCGRVRLPEFEIASALAGVNVLAIETYDTIPRLYPPKELAWGLGVEPIEAALVYSLRAAHALAALLDAPAARPLGAAGFFCLSPRVAGGFGTLDRDRLFWSDEPTEAALFHRLRQEIS